MKKINVDRLPIFLFWMLVLWFIILVIASLCSDAKGEELTLAGSDLPNIISIYGPSQVLYNGEKLNAAPLGHWVVKFKEGKILLDGYIDITLQNRTNV